MSGQTTPSRGWRPASRHGHLVSRTFYVGAKGLIVRANHVLILGDRGFRDLPGGRIDGDENPIEALARELDEELPGITEIQIGPLIGWHRPIDFDDPEHGLFLVIFHVEARLPDPIVLSHEHDRADWVPLPEAMRILGRLSIDWDAVRAHDSV